VTLSDLDLRPVAGRARPVTGALLLGPLHQDQPDLANLQSRSQGDGEAAQLHKSAIAAGNLLLPGRRPGYRSGGLDRNGLAVHDARLPRPTLGHSALQDHQRGDGNVANVQHGADRAVHRLRVQDPQHSGELQRSQIHRVHDVLDLHRLGSIRPHLLRHRRQRLQGQMGSTLLWRRGMGGKGKLPPRPYFSLSCSESNKNSRDGGF